MGILTLILIIFFIWIFAGGRQPFRSTGRDIRTTVQDAGHDLKSTGRDMADSIRHSVQ
jgi:hypothetical protein